MLVRIGPVDGAAARLWTSHLLHNLAVVRAQSSKLPFRFPANVSDAIEGLLTEWRDTAAGVEVFEWETDIDVEQARLLVRYWANLDSLTDENLRELGIEWSPPAAKPFFVALATGVAEAFAAAGEGDPFADFLAGRADDEPGAPLLTNNS